MPFQEPLSSPNSEQCCSSCWHCCLSKTNHDLKNLEANHSELTRGHNMSISILYLLSLITGASSLAVSFWVELIEVYWLHIFVIILISPTIIAFCLFLSCKTGLSKSYQPSTAVFQKRSYIIAMLPCSIATVFMDVVRFILYNQIDRSITELFFINFKLFYIAFQVLFLWKYLGVHLKESLATRIFLMHLIGTNVFLWFHEFSVHSTHSLEFVNQKYSEIYKHKAKLTVKIIEHSEPYLYPLVIQFMIIASGAAYQIWLNMRSLTSDTQDIYIDDDYGEIRPRDTSSQMRTHRFVSGTATRFDFPKTDVATTRRNAPSFLCGLAFGAIVFIGTVFSSLVLLSNKIDRDFALKIYYTYQVALFSSMSLASWLSFRELSLNRIPWNGLGGLDILLLVPMLGYLLYAEFSFVAGLTEMFSDIFGGFVFCISILRIIQVLLQTVAITKIFRNGLQSTASACCSFGPSCLMFLLFTNAGLWVTESIFDLRIPFAAPIQCRYYGISLWRAIKFALFPLCVLYRFISCSSLLEIILWSEET